jgi:RNA polymerase sigma factor for flagellar operon FliA
MFSIARNTAIDFIRKRKTIPFSNFESIEGINNFIENIKDENFNLLNEIIMNDNQNSILKGIKNLNIKQQLVLYLYYYEEMNFREIAEILNISINTIKSQHLRGIKNLRNILFKMHQN